MIIDKHQLANLAKKIIFFRGEPYTFGRSVLRFRVGSRPIRRKYIESGNDVVRNDVLQIKHFEEHFGSNDVLWDIGSHYGHYSIFAASVVKSSQQVFSFEPDEAARTVQFQNVKLNHFDERIVLFDTAVSNVYGHVNFVLEGGNSNSHMLKENLPAEGRNVSSMKSTTLNKLLKELPRPTFVKIDTEGAEIDILKEAGDLLSDDRIQFLCELHPFAWESLKVSFDDFTNIISKYGRRIKPLDEKKKLADLPFYGTVLF